MGTLDILRQKVYGRTWSEQKKNVEAEAWETPRGKGASATGGKDGIAREQFAAKRLQELGVDRIQKVETHSGGRLAFNPLGRDEQYDRIVPGVKYDSGRRSFLKKALGLGAAGGAILVAANSRGIWDLVTRNAKAAPGGAISGPTLTSSGDIDAKRIGGVRYATEFDNKQHAGTQADHWNATAIQSAINDLPSGFSLGAGGLCLVAVGYWFQSAKITWPQTAGVTLEGINTNMTTLYLQPGTNDDGIYINPGSVTYFLGLRDFTINGARLSGDTLGHGIHVASTNAYDIDLERVFCLYMPVDGIHFDGANWSARLYRPIMENNGGHGIFASANNTSILEGIVAYNLGTRGILIAGGVGSLRAVIIGVFVYQNSGMGVQLNCSRAVLSDCIIENTNTGTGDLVLCDAGADYQIHDNVLNGLHNTVYAIEVNAGLAGADIHDNDIIGTFAAGKLKLNNTATQIAMRNNRGFNPVGLLSTPFDNVNGIIGFASTSAATPTSATTYTCLGTPLDIYMAGGTVTGSVFSKNGTSIPYNSTLTFLHLEPGDTFAITYTVVPTTFSVFAL